MKRAFATAVICFGFACISISSAQESPALNLPEVVPEVVEAPLQSLITSRDRANRITIKVMVNDQGPFVFLLDTGANQSVVSESLVQRLQLEATGTATTKLRGITGEAMVSRVKVAKLQAGSLLLINRSMAVIDSTMVGLDGVLGVDGFRNKRLAVHVVGKQVTIGRSSNELPAPEYVTFPIQYRHGLLVLVPASASGTPLKAVIDTGSAASLGNAHLRSAIAAHMPYGGKPTSMRIQGVTGAIQRGETEWTSLIRLENQGIGNYQAVLIQDVPISYGDFYVFKLWNLTSEPALIVGMDILNLLDEFIIDYGRKELLMKDRKSKFADLRPHGYR